MDSLPITIGILANDTNETILSLPNTTIRHVCHSLAKGNPAPLIYAYTHKINNFY
jgi:hypothetical protein